MPCQWGYKVPRTIGRDSIEAVEGVEGYLEGMAEREDMELFCKVNR